MGATRFASARVARRDGGRRTSHRLLAARQAVADLLTTLGQDPRSERLIDTPRRVADAFAELLTPAEYTFTTVPHEQEYEGLLLVRDTAFTTLCEHVLVGERSRRLARCRSLEGRSDLALLGRALL